MKRKKLPKSLRKHIRRQKARIRRDHFSLGRQKELIRELRNKISKNYESKRDI